MNVRSQVASHLLRIKAVFLSPDEPFTWASGIKSPVYCDNRLILSDVEARDFIEEALSQMIKEKFPNIDVVVGTATAGIAHAALVADLLKLPMAYVRSSNKDHGRHNLIEGKVEKNQKVIVVEDLISTAGSSLKVCENLLEVGAEVLGVVSIFTYRMKKAEENFSSKNISSFSLCDLDSIVEQAIKEGYIKDEDRTGLLQFRDNPQDESWIKK